ncbi:MAG: hypothetical protein KC933_23190 [Myxococcales bacterium]|nr:hypothetical protein [Myxococcales bacterium]MCB9645057.1 hypothetical protein [Deltaproteobacteria bacterium]
MKLGHRLPLALPLLLVAACNADSTGSLSDGAVTSADTGAFPDSGELVDGAEPFDGGAPGDASIPPPFDGGFPDAGPFPDDGGTAQCVAPRDCFRALGQPPICPDGTPGQWACNVGVCELVCQPVITCQTDCDCPVELACGRGTCLPLNRNNQCCTNPMCPAGSTCVNPDGTTDVCPEPPDGGVPDPDGGVPTVPVGAACTGAVDCAGGFCLDPNSGFVDGYCTQQCGQGGTNCPVGASCQDFGPRQSFCLDECATAADCRAGYGCVRLGISQSRVCFPLPEGSTNPMGDPVGSGCAIDDDCAVGLTCLNDPGWPGGYCTIPYCDPQTNPCPTSSACFAFPGSFSLCLADCPSGGSMSTCRAGYYCLGPTGGQGGCIPN